MRTNGLERRVTVVEGEGEGEGEGGRRLCQAVRQYN